MRHNTMKLFVLGLLFIPFLAISQNSGAEAIFNKYSGKDGFTSVDINKGLFELFAQIDADNPEFDDFQKAIKGVESMRLIAYSLENNEGTKLEKDQFIKDIRSGIALDKFQELMVVRDKDANINFYAINEGSIIKEMLMIVDGADQAVLLSMYGDIDLNHIAKLGAAMDIGGMEYLSKMKNDKN